MYVNNRLREVTFFVYFNAFKGLIKKISLPFVPVIEGKCIALKEYKTLNRKSPYKVSNL